MSLRKSPRGLHHRPAASREAAEDASAPMTAEQLAALKRLVALTGDIDAYDETLTRAEAARRIAALTALLDREAHSGVDRLPRT